MPATFAKERELKDDDPLAFGAHLDGLGMGIDDVDELVGVEKADHKKAGIVDAIMDQNRKAEMEQEEKQFNDQQMMQDLEDIAEEDGANNDPNPDEMSSDAAPISPFADLPTAEEEAKQQKADTSRKFMKTVNVVSSDSEGHGSDTSAKKNQRLQKAKANAKPELPVVKEKSGKAKKVKYYKGQVVMSDTEAAVRKQQYNQG
jgi:hypothetical protein